MSKAMTMQELGELLRHVQAEHSFCKNNGGRHVKYIDPHLDTRDWMCFSISFRLFGNEPVTFHTQNECRDLPESLFERCMKWLDESPSNAK